MSKEAALRAMREARYNARAAGATTAAKPAKAAKAAKAAVRPPAPSRTDAPAAATPAPAEDGLCGHRSMNGRSCTREQGHTAKSHRYS